MGLAADRAVRHGPGVETLDNFVGGLHLFERHGFAGDKLKKSSQRKKFTRLIVDRPGVLGVNSRVVFHHGVL